MMSDPKHDCLLKTQTGATMEKHTPDIRRLETLVSNLERRNAGKPKRLKRTLLEEAKKHGMSAALLFEATSGKHRWDDSGMDDFEQGWQPFTRGTRVEVRTDGDIWRTGTVREGHWDTERGIHVECDEPWHDHADFYSGKGCAIMVYMNTRRGILSHIRMIDGPERA